MRAGRWSNLWQSNHRTLGVRSQMADWGLIPIVVRVVVALGLVLQGPIIGSWRLTENVAWAQIPWVINYQGRLTDSSGNAVSGTVTVKVRLYDAETGGNKKWDETHTVTMSSSSSSVSSSTSTTSIGARPRRSSRCSRRATCCCPSRSSSSSWRLTPAGCPEPC